MWKRSGILGAIAAILASSPWAAQAQTPINVSYQPAVYWALPYYLATQKGWWKEIGLAPSFSVFPAGAPQVAAAQAGSWDVGGTGSVPAVLGAARSGLLTIGITNDESKANVLMVRGAGLPLRPAKSIRSVDAEGQCWSDPGLRRPILR
jgi:NitT/TauT family transport system substrate-binding protein